MPNKKAILTPFLFTAVFGLGVFQHAQAAGELEARNIIRISHPYYRAGNPYYGNNDWSLWNYDHSRIMIYEQPYYTHPVGEVTGREFVWGYLTNCDTRPYGCVRDWSESDSITVYHNVMKKITGLSGRTNPITTNWSPYSDELNIVYSTLTSGYVVKIDVNNGASENIAYIGAHANTNPPGLDSNATQCFGWTEAERYFICFVNGEYGIHHGDQAKLVDVSRYNTTYNVSYLFPNEANYRNMNDFRGHGHDATSPSGDLYVDRCSNSGDDLCVLNLAYPDFSCYVPPYADRSQCAFDIVYDKTPESRLANCPTCTGPYPPMGTHFSWKGDESWFIMNDSGESFQANLDYENLFAPNKSIYRIYQATVDGSSLDFNELVAQETAYRWTSPNGRIDNWNSHFIATVRKDGNQLLFVSTNGKYSLEDYNAWGRYHGWNSNDWGYDGYFLVDLAPVGGNPADVNSDNHVNIKDIQICIKVITGTDTRYQNQCRVLAAPTDRTNIKDIQVIIKNIINS